MKFIRNLFFVLSILAGTNPTPAQAFELTKGTDKVTVTLYTNYDEINPGQNLEALLQFKMHGGWHIFSQNPGDVGVPTEVKWRLPMGFEVKEQSWSPDVKFITDEIVQYGYNKRAFYKTTITPTPDIMNKVPVQVDVSWLACKNECIPEKVSFYLDIPITGHDLRPSMRWIKAIQVAENSFAPQPEDGKVNVWLAMLMAFAGGIILNFMPCIFPILTLKAISLAQADYNKRKNRLEALMYTLGVVLSFLIIATVLFVLRAQGEQIGWGFQLQSPIFVGIMIIVFFVIFLMLLDIVHFRNPLANHMEKLTFERQLLNSFVTGFFAVLIASPCTAPFMGIAIGYTLTAPLYVYYPVFLALSLGYALPFALAGLFPKAIHKVLPRPGKWMDLLKKIFAIPVLLTCLWLGWVLYSQLNNKVDGDASLLQWRTYNPQEVSRLTAEKKPVFIDFTAKWCITCLVNKKAALQSRKFIKLVQEKGIILFRADWTNNDDMITSALERYGRNSIPLYVYYDGTGSEYKILPQLLTPNILEEHLR